jgi:hypothetical protein
MAEEKRTTITFPKDLSDELERVADKKGTSVAELVRKFCRLGLIAATTEGQLIVRENGQEKELILL